MAEVRYAYQDIVLCGLYMTGGGNKSNAGSTAVGATGNASLAMPARPFRVLV